MITKMMIPLLLTIGSVSAFAAPATMSASPSVTSAKDSADTPELREKLAEEILEATHAREQIESSFEQSQVMLMKDLPSDAKESMKKIMANVMSWDKVGKKFTKLYTDVFTAKELQEISIFYHSEMGKNLIAKQPEIMQKTMVMMQEIMEEAVPLIKEDIKKTQSKSVPAAAAVSEKQ